MMRFAFLALAGLTIAWHDLAVAQASQRPNILFLFTDDHARHAMSCYGSKINQTPNLDRIANEGIRFDRCYVTNSICGPCRAVVLTGKYNHLNGYYRNGLTFDGSQQTFVKLLQKSGYQTAIVGKWHLQSDPTGFDYWNVLIGQGRRLHHRPHHGLRARLAQEPAGSQQALPLDVPTQGAAPQLAAQPQAFASL
jgi:arylsulfatase A-like enzyme